MSQPWAAAIGAFAFVAIVLVLQDAFEVMLLPRRVQRRTRFAVIYFRTVWRACSSIATGLGPGRGREGMLSHFGALSMLGLFASWATTLIVGFGVLEWAQEPAAKNGASSSLFDQFYMSGVTFFTLGYGDVVPHSGIARLTAVIEAGVGLGFIALVIGYLPLIHQLFSGREVLVIQLDSRAGSPPTAAGLLCKHATALRELDDFLRAWELWGAQLLEGHLSYPMLAYYRSQHENQSWLAALTAVTDCCALILVGVGDAKPFQARMTFEVMRQVAVEMARSFRIAPSRYDGDDRLPLEACLHLQAVLARSGLDWQVEGDAFLALRALRATYEPLLDGLAQYLMLPLPEWLPNDDAADHWTRGHRGLLAKRLIEQLAKAPQAGEIRDETGQVSPWRRLRTWLRQ
ncbi:potassium channel family protein [Acidisoma sp. L85]|uniref:potassium channel family protein n=1 Tax=Acidisoma sp. L85 TaxID=1641850 RepID=UPI00131DF264|nr:potassium channel family protein [Acidisoma sp. L85]